MLISRQSLKTYFHYQKVIDGVLYIEVKVFLGDDPVPIEIHYTRGDLVKG